MAKFEQVDSRGAFKPEYQNLSVFQSDNSTVPELVAKTGRVSVGKGVYCDTYDFLGSKSVKDLGIIHIKQGAKTPRQLVLSGFATVEAHVQGRATLAVEKPDGHTTRYRFRDGLAHEAVAVEIGDIMQWRAKTKSTCAEICYPPYADGRYENLPN